jgi:hypothetical protein
MQIELEYAGNICDAYGYLGDHTNSPAEETKIWLIFTWIAKSYRINSMPKVEIESNNHPNKELEPKQSSQ